METWEQKKLTFILNIWSRFLLLISAIGTVLSFSPSTQDSYSSSCLKFLIQFWNQLPVLNLCHLSFSLNSVSLAIRPLIYHESSIQFIQIFLQNMIVCYCFLFLFCLFFIFVSWWIVPVCFHGALNVIDRIGGFSFLLIFMWQSNPWVLKWLSWWTLHEDDNDQDDTFVIFSRFAWIATVFQESGITKKLLSSSCPLKIYSDENAIVHYHVIFKKKKKIIEPRIMFSIFF